MKGNQEVIEVLQDVLSAELTAINQYFIHARMCRNWRYQGLADHIHKESIGEMKHAQVLKKPRVPGVIPVVITAL